MAHPLSFEAVTTIASGVHPVVSHQKSQIRLRSLVRVLVSVPVGTVVATIEECDCSPAVYQRPRGTMMMRGAGSDAGTAAAEIVRSRRRAVHATRRARRLRGS
jgi:hypothetical protein